MKIIRKILMAVVGIFIFCNFAMWDVAAGYPLAGVIIIIPCVVFVIIKKIKKQKFIGLLLIIPVLYFFFFWKIASNNYENAQRNGQIIIATLEKFKTANGKYPENITALSPNYISSFPRCSCNLTSRSSAYFYKSDGNNFKLQGHCGYNFYTYDSNIKSWSRQIIN